VTDKVRELAENAASNIAGWFTAGKDTSAYWMPIDVITQAIQQALDAQAAEVVALREALNIYVQASKFTGFHRAGANPVVDHFQVNLSPDDHAKINIALTQPNTRAAQIMAVVEAAKEWYDAYCNKEGPVWFDKEQALLNVMDSYLGLAAEALEGGD
jgi:hypothetical protein